MYSQRKKQHFFLFSPRTYCFLSRPNNRFYFCSFMNTHAHSQCHFIYTCTYKTKIESHFKCIKAKWKLSVCRCCTYRSSVAEGIPSKDKPFLMYYIHVLNYNSLGLNGSSTVADQSFVFCRNPWKRNNFFLLIERIHLLWCIRRRLVKESEKNPFFNKSRVA